MKEITTLFVALLFANSCSNSDSENTEIVPEYNLIKIEGKQNGGVTYAKTFNSSDCEFKSTVKIESNNNFVSNYYNNDYNSSTGVSTCTGKLKNSSYNTSNNTVEIDGLMNKVNRTDNMLILSNTTSILGIQTETIKYFQKK
jgi:hypothetical protein